MYGVETCELFDTERSIAGFYLSHYKYPWEALDDIGAFIYEFTRMCDKSEYSEREPGVFISATAQTAPDAVIAPPAIVCPGARIRHGAFIRGCAVIGRDCVVGNSTEIKNSILFDSVEVPHFNYIGDSVLGFHAHFGAGTVTSNIKSDRTDIVVRAGNIAFPTGRRKVGSMLGDRTEIGCNCTLNPGTVIGKDTTVYPNNSVRGVVAGNCIYKDREHIIEKHR